MNEAVDVAEVLVDGPWQHRFVAANGGRFHVAALGEGPLVLLLHGFPQFWWAWRHQLTALAEAGFTAVAMDLRGYGGSDKPPRGYDTPTLAADVAAVVRALGRQRAIVVGHDWGAWIAWSMPALQPQATAAVGALSMGHPLALRAALIAQAPTVGRLLAFQLPLGPEHSLTHDGVARVLSAWAGPSGLPPEAVERYRRAMRLPFVAHTSMEYYRWALRSLLRRDGRRFAAALRSTEIVVPVLQLHGRLDPWITQRAAATSARWVGGRYRFDVLPGAGHFLPEEAPEEVNAHLLDWLSGSWTAGVV